MRSEKGERAKWGKMMTQLSSSFCVLRHTRLSRPRPTPPPPFPACYSPPALIILPKARSTALIESEKAAERPPSIMSASTSQEAPGEAVERAMRQLRLGGDDDASDIGARHTSSAAASTRSTLQQQPSETEGSVQVEEEAASLDPDTLAECLQMQEDEILAMLSIYEDGEASEAAAPAAATTTALARRQKPFDVLRSPQSSSDLALATTRKGKGKSDASAPAAQPAGGALVRLRIPITFDPPRRVAIRHLPSDAPGASDRWTTIDKLAHLPPLEMTLRLPRSYPLAAPPQLASYSAPWLVPLPAFVPARARGHNPAEKSAQSRQREVSCAQRRWIERQVARIWEEEAGRAECLMMLADWAGSGLEQAAEREHPFRLDGAALASLSNSTAGLDAQDWSDALLFTTMSHDTFPSPGDALAAQLGRFDADAHLRTFNRGRYDCSICLETIKGAACTRLAGCGHVFCTGCLREYTVLMVNEGNWRAARECPGVECAEARAARAKAAAAAGEGAPSLTTTATVAATATANYIHRTELSALVGAELLKRYDWLERKTLAETDPHVSFCPLPSCAGAIARGEAGDAATYLEGLRICTECEYAFCRFCEKAWHGKDACALSQMSALVERYCQAAEGSQERAAMERRYGAKNIRRLVKIHQEESANRKWITENSTRCPSCNVPVQKCEYARADGVRASPQTASPQRSSHIPFSSHLHSHTHPDAPLRNESGRMRAHDVPAVRLALLLFVLVVAQPGEPVQALQHAGDALLPEALPRLAGGALRRGGRGRGDGVAGGARGDWWWCRGCGGGSGSGRGGGRGAVGGVGRRMGRRAGRAGRHCGSSLMRRLREQRRAHRRYEEGDAPWCCSWLALLDGDVAYRTVVPRASTRHALHCSRLSRGDDERRAVHSDRILLPSLCPGRGDHAPRLPMHRDGTAVQLTSCSCSALLHHCSPLKSPQKRDHASRAVAFSARITYSLSVSSAIRRGPA